MTSLLEQPSPERTIPNMAQVIRMTPLDRVATL